MGVVQRRARLYPARKHVGGGQGVQILVVGCLPAVMNGVDLPETGLLALLRRVERAYRDAAFERIPRFREAFPPQSEGRAVFLQPPVDGRGAYPASFAAISGAMPKAGHDAMRAICSRSSGASIFPRLCRKNAQTLRRLPMASSP